MAILPLSQLDGWSLADPARDIRGRQVVSAGGRLLGVVTELAVNTETEFVEHAVLDNGRALSLRDLEPEGDALRLV